jgi:YHS domain-containing protein
MKTFYYRVLEVILIILLTSIIAGCAKKETPKEQVGSFTSTGLMEDYRIDFSPYPKPAAMDTTASAKGEMVTCAYDKMQLKKSAMQAQMRYKGKTLYFCTKEEMEKFKKNPEGYLSGKIKPN